jgi:hypothetical protein
MGDHPLNRGILNDMQAAIVANHVTQITERAGVLFWLGCCHTLMSAIVAAKANDDQAREMLCDMLGLGLRGLGVASNESKHIISWAFEVQG